MFSSFGLQEMVLIGVIALMLFGSRLPEVARNFGATYRDLRKKIDEFQREFHDWDKTDTPASRPAITHEEDETERVEPASPKFTPPPREDEDSLS